MLNRNIGDWTISREEQQIEPEVDNKEIWKNCKQLVTISCTKSEEGDKNISSKTTTLVWQSAKLPHREEGCRWQHGAEVHQNATETDDKNGRHPPTTDSSPADLWWVSCLVWPLRWQMWCRAHRSTIWLWLMRSIISVKSGLSCLVLGCILGVRLKVAAAQCAEDLASTWHKKLEPLINF